MGMKLSFHSVQKDINRIISPFFPSITSEKEKKGNEMFPVKPTQNNIIGNSAYNATAERQG